jgi:trehalose 6-phosphate synthase/phosphatase
VSRVVIVANRLPVTVTRVGDVLHAEPSVGGLATGLRRHHERSGGLWIGWAGYPEVLGAGRSPELARLLAPLGAVPVPLSVEEVTRYYEGISNGVLWPLFHYLLDQMPLRVEHWRSYVVANERFADAIAAHHRPGDQVWVHDYQLMLVPAMLRERVPGARIGFFLHIPFPSAEVFATLRCAPSCCAACSAPTWSASTRRRTRGTSGARCTAPSACRSTRTSTPRASRTAAAPRAWASSRWGWTRRTSARARAATPWSRALAHVRAPDDEALLLGVDRLDYTKGIPRRLLAYEQLLARHPDLRGHVRLVQLAVPSREGVKAYQRIRRDVERLVGRINGAFGTAQWAPIHYLYRSVSDAELLALYRAAAVMLVTPLRDGMNLVAKEFVASRADEDGVLVLSEFTGAADELPDALQVNPYDVDGCAAAFYRALTMPRAERGARMRALRARVSEYDVHAWSSSFLAALGAVPE